MQFEDVRFLSSVLVIVTHALIINFLASTAHGSLFSFSRPLIFVYASFLYFWFSVFGQWISRSRRATFNEQNILLTYQPRALTHGHLFVPDPPTPARANPSDTSPIAESCTASEFRNARDAHYRDEFHHAKKAAEERKLMMEKPVKSMRIEFDDTSSQKSDASPGHHI